VRSKGIQVEVAHEFEQIGLLLTQDGLVPVLEQITVAAVAPVEFRGIPGEQSPHHEV
jgi:hypothetical protein